MTKKRVQINICIFADTDRPEILASDLVSQIRYNLKAEPEYVVGDRAVAFLSDCKEVTPEMEAVGKAGADVIMEAMNQPSEVRQFIAMKSIDPTQ